MDEVRRDRPSSRSEDLILGLVIAVVVLGVGAISAVVEIAHAFEPEGGLLGKIGRAHV